MRLPWGGKPSGQRASGLIARVSTAETINTEKDYGHEVIREQSEPQGSSAEFREHATLWKEIRIWIKGFIAPALGTKRLCTFKVLSRAVVSGFDKLKRNYESMMTKLVPYQGAL